MPDCCCLNPPFSYLDYEVLKLGIDHTNGRYGEVTLETCKHCGTHWLKYHVEYESDSSSGAWFRGQISDLSVAAITPANAITFLEQLPCYFIGGSRYHSTGMRSTGKICADW